MSLKTLTVGSALAGLIAALPAHADSIQFDDNLVHGGTLSFGGGVPGLNALVGTDILIDSVMGVLTPANSGAHSVFAGDIDFTTGALISATAYSSTFFQYVFAPGGSITVTGGVPDASIANFSTLASGTFSGVVTATVNNGAIALQFGSGSDDKHDALETYFGYTPSETTWTFGNSTIAAEDVSIYSTDVTAANYLGFSGTVTNTDFDNVPKIGGSSVVPVPAAIWLFGSALAGMGTIGGWRRRAVPSQAAA